jgi:flagellar hook-associated protein 2
MGISPLVFTGISEFSDDLRTILNRAVSIASLPLVQMQNEQADLLTKKQILTDLQSAAAGMASAVRALGAAGRTRALSASSSNTSRVTVSLNGATQAGTYTLSEITSVAKAASETTLSGYATADGTAVSSDGILELVVGSTTYEIDLTGEGKNNLNGLRDAINALGAGVTASVLNTGTGEEPYYLVITATSPGERALELRETAGDSGTNVLTAANQGSNAIFKLNGLDVVKSDNVMSDVIPGLTFTIVSKTDPGETVELKLFSSRSTLATKLADMVSAYNALRGTTSAQVGETAGLLSGDFIIREIQHHLRTLTAYEGSGGIRRLADLGVEFNEQGEMSFNSSKFYSLSEAEIAAAFDYLGSESAGFGGLSRNFEQISDPISGLIKLQQDQYDTADERLSRQMAEVTSRIEFMQLSLSAKLQQADVLLAQLEAQQTLLEASIKGLELALYGKKER